MIMLIDRNGFTIVELLIVVIVIAVLAAISLVGYNGIQRGAHDSSAEMILNQAEKITRNMAEVAPPGKSLNFDAMKSYLVAQKAISSDFGDNLSKTLVPMNLAG